MTVKELPSWHPIRTAIERLRSIFDFSIGEATEQEVERVLIQFIQDLKNK